MGLPLVLGHGALGYWDEVVFILVGLIFLGMMLLSWFRSRMSQPLLEADPPPAVPTPDSTAPEHIRLE